MTRALIAVIALVTIAGPGQALRAQTRSPATVLVLFSDERLLPSTTEIAAALDQSLSELSIPTRRASAFLDLSLTPSDALVADRLRWFKERYGQTPVDVVVALGDPAAEFAARFGSSIWPEASAVYTGRNMAATLQRSSLSPSTAIVTDFDYAGTAAAALRMVPGTRSIVLVAGASAADANFLKTAVGALAELSSQITISTMTGLPFDEYRRRLAALPPDTIVLPVMFFADSDGRSFAPPDAIRELAEASSRPMFSVYGTWNDGGIVGGHMLDYSMVGRVIGQAVSAMLNGRPPSARVAIPVSNWVFDARQLRRWNIDRRGLPAGSTVLFEQPSVFTRYRNEILATGAIIAMQAAAIAGLLVQRARRRKMEAFNRAVMQSMPAESAVLDRRGVIISTNDLWTQAQPATGNAGLRGVIGETYCAEALTEGENLRNADRVRVAVQAVLDGQRSESVVDYDWFDNQQARCWSQVRVRRLARESGGVLINHIDLSSRRRAETELQRQLHEHAHLSTMATVGETAGAMAHELNQPLAAMLSNAQALRHVLRQEKPDTDEVESILQDIIEADQRAADVITRVRRLIKKDAFELHPVDVNAVVRDSIHIVRQMPTSSGVSISDSLVSDGTVVSADRVQLQQVIINLLQNAIQAVQAHRRDGSVAVATSSGAGLVELIVQDNGSGIPANEIGRIFDPFYTTKREGLGLGLSISRSIVELHGGTLQAANRPEGGAVFSITLPRAAQALAS